MLCPARCSCFLCRELQSCRAADSRKPHKMSDNFILKKAEAWDSSAMKFIRGAARMSVRHWAGREPPRPHKATSCEQLYPPPDERHPMRRAPSTDRIKPDQHKPLFKLLGNSKNKKPNTSDASEPKARRSVLNFRKHESKDSKNVHEKYVPLPQNSTLSEHIYSEPRPWSSQFDDCCRPPVYQSVEKFNRMEENSRVTPDRKLYGRPPCYDELTQKLAQDKTRNRPCLPLPESAISNKITQNNNKVVIYFGDSIIRKHSEQKKEESAAAEVKPKPEAIYANRLIDETENLGLSRGVDKGGGTLVSEVEVQEAIYAEVSPETPPPIAVDGSTYKKDDGACVSSDGFLVVEIEGSFERARQLVDALQGGADHHEATVLDEDEDCDWSFIQGWRRRPSSGCRPEDPSWSGARALRVRVTTAAGAPPHARRLSPPPPAHRATTPPRPADNTHAHKPQKSPAAEEPPCPDAGAQLKPVCAPSQLTVQSTPVRCAPVQSSYGLEKRSKEDLRPAESLPQNVVRDCNSSSDENRSSGHASMSDSGGGDAARDEPRRARQPPHHGRQKHRPHNKLQSPWAGGGGLDEIRSAIKQLTLRSRDSSSTATSGASSAGGSNHGNQESNSAAEARRRRAPLVRQPSLDTVCTNVTSADEFVWVDSHNRLVELRCVPWTPTEITRALQSGRCRDVATRFAPDTPPRLAYLLQRALVRIARETQRLSHNFGFCSKHEVAGALRIVLSAPLADACIKGCQRAATMYATSGGAARRLGSAARAHTALAPGRFQRWMRDANVAPVLHE
ncbi:hypothetical protein JYU34_009955 [Plutella xylostella]|uniref:ABTB2/3 histone-like domain-containing protein n=1 Tax=Plutella xylostella TaxID=51655 RepID=A0ABQ7QLN4_PLUXY|nr:hypothetical protein JYU34_009955 [Plutella xylostella]